MFHDPVGSMKAPPFVPIVWGRADNPTYTKLTVAEIATVCARFAGVSIDELNSPRRSQSLCRARQAGMYFAAKHTDKSFPEIGRRFGGRDHSTAMRARDRVAEDLAGDGEKYGAIITHLQSALGISPVDNGNNHCDKRAKRGRRG